MHGSPRIIVLRPGALGDALLALPTLALLRRKWPRARITFAARPDVLALARASGLADATLPFDDPVFSALWHVEPPQATGARAALLAGADVAVAWVSDTDGVVARHLRALGVRRVLVAPGRPPAPSMGVDGEADSEVDGEHVALYLLRTLAPLLQLDSDAVGAPVALPRSLAELSAWMPAIVPAVADAARAAAVWDELTQPQAIRMSWRAGAEDHLRDEVSTARPAAERHQALDRGQAAHTPSAQRVVALHPGSGGAAKCWPAECFARLAAWLWQTGVLPLVLAGPADAAAVERLLAAYAEHAEQIEQKELAERGADVTGRGTDAGLRDLAAPTGTTAGQRTPGAPAPPRSLPVARDLSLPVLAGLLARCDALVGNDSGVSHLAGLVGCPTLALFGPSDPAVWAPVGRRVLTLRAPVGAAGGARAMDALPFAEAWAALRRLLASAERDQGDGEPG